MTKTRRTYTPEFKAEAVKLVTEQGCSVSRSWCGPAKRSLQWRYRRNDRAGEDAMIFHLTQKLNAKIKTGTLRTLPLDENPFADWSAHLFVAGRTQYILLSNTKSLYSTVMYGKGTTGDSAFIERALSSIREFMEDDGQEFVYERFIAPASASVRFAKALNRSVTGSINELIQQAAGNPRHALESSNWLLPGAAFSQLGGHPTWIQDAQYPPCLKCGLPMFFVGQLSNEDFQEYGEGIYYIFLCKTCKITATTYQQS